MRPYIGNIYNIVIIIIIVIIVTIIVYGAERTDRSRNPTTTQYNIIIVVTMTRWRLSLLARVVHNVCI